MIGLGDNIKGIHFNFKSIKGYSEFHGEEFVVYWVEKVNEVNLLTHKH